MSKPFVGKYIKHWENLSSGNYYMIYIKYGMPFYKTFNKNWFGFEETYKKIIDKRFKYALQKEMNNNIRTKW